LKNYLFYRESEQTSTVSRIKKQGLSNNFDFLDSLADLGRAGSSWTLNVSESGEQIRLRNLEWIGFEFQLEVNTTKHVAAYFGYGEKNTDIMFML